MEKKNNGFERDVIDRLARIETLIQDYPSVIDDVADRLTRIETLLKDYPVYKEQVNKNRESISNIKTVWTTIFAIIMILQIIITLKGAF